MRKKGEFTGLAKNKLAGFILVLVIAVALLAFIGKISFKTNDISVEEQCRASVLRNAQYHVAGIELGTNIDCPTRTLELKESDSDKEAKKKLADAMYSCWRQFGQGKLNLFNENKVFCNVCYIVDVKTTSPINNFAEHLMTTPSPTENMYYYDYLSSFETSRAGEVLGELEKQKISLKDQGDLSNDKGSNKYAILFVYAKGQNNFEKIKRQLSGESAAGKVIAPIAIGLGVGAAAVILATAPVSAPVIAVVGASIGVGAGEFALTHFVGILFNADSPPEWAAFNFLIPWNPDETPAILQEQLGCKEFVETQSN